MSELRRASSASAALAEFAAQLDVDTLPKGMVVLATEAIAELLRAAAAGMRDEYVEGIASVVGVAPAVAEASVVGRRRFGAANAAMLNAAAAQCRPDGAGRLAERQIADVVAAASLALGEVAPAKGVELLAAVAGGLEVAARITLALGSSHLERGWRLAGTAGRVGAAVGASRVLGSSADASLVAIAFAATQAAGFTIDKGVTVGALVAGRAANDGVESAVIAAAGLIGDPLPLEGRRGLLALMSDETDSNYLDDRLGFVWHALELSPNDGPIRDDQLATAASALGGGGSISSLIEAARSLAGS